VTIKDWFKILIWPQNGGTSPELVDMSYIRTSLNEGDVDRLESLEDRVTALDDGTTGDVVLVKSIVGDESEGLVKTVADNSEILANTMKPGTPVAATAKASLTIGTTNTLTFEAINAGVDGNLIKVKSIIAGASESLALLASGNQITISLKTDEASAPISTHAKIVNAIMDTGDPAYNAEVAAKITASLTGVTTTILGATDFAFLTGGLNNGTSAAKGASMFDDDFIYIAIDDCDGSADMSNWKKVALAAFYSGE